MTDRVRRRAGATTALALGVGSVLVAIGCSVAGDARPGTEGSAPQAGATAGAAAGATPYDPIARCVSQVGYWTPIVVSEEHDGGLDYQEMGLSGTTYEALREVVAAADREPTTPDARWIADRATAACTSGSATASPRSSGPGWP